MKKTSFLFLPVLLLLLASCESKEIVSFTSAFPAPNKDLTRVLGHELQLLNGKDTTRLRIAADRHTNLITFIPSGDTLFYGKVSKHRGLYYFNQRRNDSTYHIYAVKIDQNLVWGLGTDYEQTHQIRKKIARGLYPELITFIAADSNTIRLRPVKKSFRSLFPTMLASFKPDTIISAKEPLLLKQLAQANSKETAVPEELDETRVYPNPASDVLHVESQLLASTYKLLDVQGKQVLQGSLNKSDNTIAVDKLANGLYVLSIYHPENNTRENIRVLKQ